MQKLKFRMLEWLPECFGTILALKDSKYLLKYYSNVVDITFFVLIIILPGKIFKLMMAHALLLHLSSSHKVLICVLILLFKTWSNFYGVEFYLYTLWTRLAQALEQNIAFTWHCDQVITEINKYDDSAIIKSC